ncbi:neuroligin-4, X-linked-like [Physella acuta]|uniref:neuroligin-4, X-linked-like n=1 Tax=Physella acuta TaxID=109671 RepID=UPI0027DAE084|nr:neuroligin-4, X-linked-like [Physella acuta]
MMFFARMRYKFLEQALVYVLFLIPLLQNGFGRVVIKGLSDRIVSTRYGKVRGVLVEFENQLLRRRVEAYYGLRYADLDNGGMRFMPPKNPKENWNGIRVAVDHSPVCPQPIRHERDYSQQLPEGRVTHLRNITPFLSKQMEDCLNLNLHVPIQEWNETTPMAVMVFVHGESYETGTGNAYDGSVLSSFGNVIVVTLNYRLGVLGFLTTGDNFAMGNYALLDITQALLWLRENIASFGGDPQKITLFGHGTGAALVNLLLLSPFVSVSENKVNYFQRAILQSGSATSTWAMSYDPKWCMEKLAMNVNCSHHTPNTLMLTHCLRERSFADLVRSAPEAPKYYSCFAPTKDTGSVLPKELSELIKEPHSKFASVPVMFGITKNEAYAYLKQSDIRKGISDFRKTQIIRTYVQNVFRYHRQKIFEILDHHYTDWSRPPDPRVNRASILELLSDGQYVAPLIQMANYHAEKADTYLYSFGYSTQSDPQNESEDNVQGIHGDELPYVFGSPLVNGTSPFPSVYNDAERMMAEAVMTYWTNFAKSGNPNEPRNQTSVFGEKVNNRFVDLKWPKYNKEKQEYLAIDPSESTGRRPLVRNRYRASKMAVWLDLIPKIDRSDGEDAASHQLDHFDNLSTFDDSDHLVPNDDSVFPSPPPMPPTRPTPFPYQKDDSGTTHYPHYAGVTVDEHNFEGDTLNFNHHQSSQHTGLPNSSKNAAHGNTYEPDMTSEPIKSEHKTATTGVPLSIVVAIGGSLLLINVIIFAGLCYQRERMRKMRLISKPIPPPDMDIDDLRLTRKIESNRSSPCIHGECGTGHECVSLISGADSHQQTASPSKMCQGSTHVHNPSPQPSLHSKRGQSQTRTTPPLDPIVCNYTPVPTQVTSPMHRTHVGVSQGGAMGPGADTNTYVNSQPRPPSDANHKPDGVNLSTFGTGHHNISGRGNHTTAAVSGSVNNVPTSTPSGAVDDPLYKTINKSGQTNAVTILLYICRNQKILSGKLRTDSVSLLSETDPSESTGRRPLVRNRYRASKMAVWLDLIPKMNLYDGGDMSTHLLNNFENLSTFDEPQCLIPNKDVYPPRATAPSTICTTASGYVDRVAETTSDNTEVTTGQPYQPNSELPNSTKGSPDPHATPEQMQSTHKATSTGVPLSIVVAIGGSLLLINIIIFAGLCYQRERMRKMRLISKPIPPPDMDIDDLRVNRKMKSNRSSPCVQGESGTGHECVSLISGASAHQQVTSPLKNCLSNTHVHNQSPQLSVHSKRGQSQTRATPPLDPIVCNYTPVPTQVTSPMHRTHVGVSQGGSLGQGVDPNTYINSKPRPPSDANHKPDGVNLSTFGTGHHSISGRGNHTTAAVSGPVNNVPTSTPSGTVDDPLYKTINKSGQHNAVTIV